LIEARKEAFFESSELQAGLQNFRTGFSPNPVRRHIRLRQPEFVPAHQLVSYPYKKGT
jgi:hypothetical protein